MRLQSISASLTLLMLLGSFACTDKQNDVNPNISPLVLPLPRPALDSLTYISSKYASWKMYVKDHPEDLDPPYEYDYKVEWDCKAWPSTAPKPSFSEIEKKELLSLG
jgi:hypothetical protein